MTYLNLALATQYRREEIERSRTATLVSDYLRPGIALLTALLLGMALGAALVGC